MILESVERRIHQDGDGYKRTVVALKAIANELMFDDKNRIIVPCSAIHSGRKFKTSKANARSPETDVTPDMALLLANDVGFICEAKFGFDRDEQKFTKRVGECIEQIEKYDDDLLGWRVNGKEDGRCEDHDLILLVNFEDAKKFVKALETHREENGFDLTRAFAVVSVCNLNRAEGSWDMLDLEYGALSDGGKSDKLGERIPIRPELVESNPIVGLVELYDEEPPVPIMMDLIHNTVFRKLDDNAREQYNIEGSTNISFSLSNIRRWLQEYSFPVLDSRDKAVPEDKWIVKAIHQLKTLNWIEVEEGKANRWVYIFKKGRKGIGNPYKRFVQHYAKSVVQAKEKADKAKLKKQEKEKRKAAKAKKNAPLFNQSD